jgi:polygalacturonase
VTSDLPRRTFLLGVAAAGVAVSITGKRARRPVVDVRDHGAKGDGRVRDTKAIQRAVNEAADVKGTVRFPKGRYRSGTVRLRSGIEVVLEAGATLLMSKDTLDFLRRERLPYVTGSDFETSDFQNSLLFGDRLHDIIITGEGTIDCVRENRFGPKPIALRRCRNVAVRGIAIRNSPNYCVSLGGCDDVEVEGVTIRDAFADGIDPDCCRRVHISGCDIESDDDAVVLKTSLILGTPRSTEDVTVVDCRLNSPSNGFKIGTETSGDVRGVRVERCQISGKPRAGADPLGLTTTGEGSGVAIESVDGALVEDVRISDLTVTDADVPIFVRLGARGRGQKPGPIPGAIRDVTIRGLTATGATDACTISGIPGHAIERLTLEDVHVTVTPMSSPPVESVPELEAEYPQAGMFGPLPATGVFARHATHLTLRNVRITVDGGDSRALLGTDDVTGLVVDPPLA